MGKPAENITPNCMEGRKMSYKHHEDLFKKHKLSCRSENMKPLMDVRSFPPNVATKMRGQNQGAITLFQCGPTTSCCYKGIPSSQVSNPQTKCLQAFFSLACSNPIVYSKQNLNFQKLLAFLRNPKVETC